MGDCFKLFGTNKRRCVASNECFWDDEEGCYNMRDSEEKPILDESEDGCFKRFANNKSKCITGEALRYCVWKDGHGCYMRPKPMHAGARKDGCFKRFGKRKRACLSEKVRKDCVWKEGEGCFLRSTGNADAEGKEADEKDTRKMHDCFELFGTNKRRCVASKKCVWDDG